MKKKRKIALFLFLIFVFLTLWVFRPYKSYDKEKVIPAITNLVEPYRLVEAASSLDGGSVGIKIIDAEGREFLACIPQPEHNTLFVGVIHYSKDGAVEVDDPSDSISSLLEIVRNHKEVSHFIDHAVATASKRIRDYLRILYRNLSGQYPPIVYDEDEPLW